MLIRLLAVVVWLVGTGLLWSRLTPRPRAEFEVPGTIVCVTDYLAVVTSADESINDSLSAWDIATGRRVWAAYSSPDVVSTAEATPDSRRVVVHHFDAKSDEYRAFVDLRDTGTGELIWRTEHPSRGRVAFSPPAGMVAAVASETLDAAGRRRSWCDLVDTATGGLLRRLEDATEPRFSPDGRRLFCPRGDGVVVYEAATGEVVTHLRAVPNPEWLRDSRHVVGTDDVVWAVDAGTATERLGLLDRFRRNHLGPLLDGPVNPGGCMTLESCAGLSWRLADGRRRTPGLAAHLTHTGWNLLPCERAMRLTLYDHRPAGTIGCWLARLHPTFADWGRDEERYTELVFDLDTADTLATLTDGYHAARLSADGRTLFTVQKADDQPTRVGVLDVPVASRSQRLAGVLFGWAVQTAGLGWLVRRAGRR